MSAGSLSVVGTGIELGSHLTAEARSVIERADLVLCVVGEPAALAWLEGLNPRTRSLHGLYEVGRLRTEVYAAIVDAVLEPVREGLDVCLALYGHPGVFVAPSHDAIDRARSEGFPTRLLPGISAEDCLFADLGIDPGSSGWQSYEATAFLAGGRRADPTAALVLWQVGVVGDDRVTRGSSNLALPQLVDALRRTYPADHAVVVYEASPYPGFGPLIRRVPLGELSGEHVTALSTLYVSPFQP
jgi:uncharacterized protein YabN with tetrapyrrole methylase and pyrophosphatase domain